MKLGNLYKLNQADVKAICGGYGTYIKWTKFHTPGEVSQAHTDSKECGTFL